VDGGQLFDDTLAMPETNENYYRDIAVFAYPSPVGKVVSTNTEVPIVSTSKPTIDAQFLTDPNNTKNFSSADSCWIQYAFKKPFTCRSIVIHSKTNYQSNRLIIETSDDGKNFKFLQRLVPPRSGWQDWEAPYTHAIPATTVRFFRFVFSKSGSEPGAEDLDAAKWKPVLKIAGIELSSEPKIDEYEGKNGEVWRISKRTSEQQVPDKICVPLNQIVDVTKFMDPTGHLKWKVPSGNWTIIRIGHTSTGHKNDTGGGGKGLECDKFDPAAIKVQFDNWFAKMFKKIPNASDVLKIFHVDSWECGSQNWSPVFREEFKKRRGYDLYSYLPVMAGVPVESADLSERFLHDIRETIIELLHDNFYVTLANLAHEKGCAFTAESVAPTMVSDGMLHYNAVDIPMGEFWLRSPTHDKPNDMLDAISAGHIYGKQIIQAEAFTELRLMWDEYPGMLKTLQDRNYALGINRLVYHVFMHNPSPDKKPGMTLDGIGLFFQRDQTWWKQGKAWVDYAKRCQALLRVGRPVTDIAVFTGEEIPRRAVLPDRLVTTLPGIFGKTTVNEEKERLLNLNAPIKESPRGVFHSANIINPGDWVNPLNGYAYDSYNKDALLHFSKVENGEIELKGGAKYKLLVIPGDRKMSPNAGWMSVEVARKLKGMVENGATLLVSKKPHNSISLNNHIATDKELNFIVNSIWDHKQTNKISGFTSWKVGKGRVVQTPFEANSFEALGIERDFIATDLSGKPVEGIAWTHRAAPGLDIYFVSNQKDKERKVELSLRIEGREPELWDAVTGKTMTAKTWQFKKGRTLLPVKLAANGSIFIVMKKATKKQSANNGK
ncbi:MAG TPA: glycosyl hydrolase, partial [Hanamia sp.]|nr:glycosyl hydrolase [Hanamia sp.]